ncbi:unnamed protein product (macronuclear) [Paramecium tetraurelia]|uniref:Uncharacterized protein n=1 Tax=Paramecium tetraurelia TaxID=5888 RepID=A0CGH6_PARTE|nr:uncharacterized protein GSPATT00007333001 [Paramecium tetraurelia]CAK69893.1 unnamed protein product [Paramecium tetraurelia]|eukprot:XP_001437290.1 hypothetical protein (macronuclear) [Paramecium tetraurelia strain d4-2]
MSQVACFGNFSPIPSLGPEGQWKRQREHDDIEKMDDKTRGKRVRFKIEGAPPDPVEPSCSEEDVELN